MKNKYFLLKWLDKFKKHLQETLNLIKYMFVWQTVARSELLTLRISRAD